MSLIIHALKNPKETFEKERHNATFFKALLYLVFAGVILGVYAIIISVITMFFGAEAPILGSLLTLILFPIILVFSVFFSTAFYWIIAKILGGKGSFSSLFYLNSIIVLVISALGIIPILNLIVIIYAYYLMYLAIKISQELSTGRALIVLFLPWIIQIVLGVLIVGLLFASVGALLIG